MEVPRRRMSDPMVLLVLILGTSVAPVNFDPTLPPLSLKVEIQSGSPAGQETLNFSSTCDTLLSTEG